MRRALATTLTAASMIVLPTVARAESVDGPATPSAPAARGARMQLNPPPPAPDVSNPALAGCDAAVLQGLMEHRPDVRQWVIILTAATTSTSATVQIASVRADRWECTMAPASARLGRNGIRPLLQRRSGDGTTPSGVFPLGVVGTPQGPISFFGNSADPGVRGAYRRVQPGDCYGARPNTSGYGHWRVDQAGCTGADELLTSYGAVYEHAALIGANTEPNVSGDAPGEIPYASAIFLHRTSYTSTGASKSTSGCVTLAHDALVTAMRAIDPTLHAHFAIGTSSQLRALPPAYP
jgi:L,D-peptidoglycan transpeptidase YkuD (ErfK/YbiS/YcfS/YnhG family)